LLTLSLATICPVWKDELGDLLLQVVFTPDGPEQGAFDFGDVVQIITTKLIRRHPHVFADAEGRPLKLSRPWERIKAEEKPSAARRHQRSAAGCWPPCPR
jgi:ATP diphosphatase